MNVKQNLLTGFEKGAKYVVLLDPDKLDASTGADYAANCSDAGVDALFVGGSTGSHERFSNVVQNIKARATIPVILFPGSAEQIVPYFDAVLFMSLLSGRNPRFLIEEQLRGVPAIWRHELETIAMGYLLVESDAPTAVERISQTKPLPRNDNESAMHHALAAQYFGMDCVYLEAGSGANLTVPEEMIRVVRSGISIPLIVGGGIRTPEIAAQKVKAGADIIVTGNILEKDAALLPLFVRAVHGR
ncbi:MAG: geranylgeranylglyceryl/heptaprenylglyceryl phosphate synthase [Fibrobacterota bacterium]